MIEYFMGPGSARKLINHHWTQAITSFFSLVFLMMISTSSVADVDPPSNKSPCQNLLEYQLKYGLTPEEKVYQEFLSSVAEHIKRNHIKPTSCFISYAWEDISTPEGINANKTLQSFLIRLRNDLQKVEVNTYLDIENLNGQIRQWMKTHIDNSEYIILVGSPRYKERCSQKTNVAFEFALAKMKAKNKPDALIPLLYQGDFSNAFPDDVNQHLIRDIKRISDYYQMMVGEHPVGIISAIYPSFVNDKEYIALRQGYEAQVNNLKLELEKRLKPNKESSSRPLGKNRQGRALAEKHSR